MTFQNSQILVAILILIGIIILWHMFNKDTIIHNEGVLDTSVYNDPNNTHDNVSEDYGEQDIDEDTKKKLNWKNKAGSGSSRYNYANGGNSGSEFDKYFQTNADIVSGGYEQSNNNFNPIDETGGVLASYSGKGQSKHTPEDLFDANKMLPQETKNDWFEVMPEPIQVKNRHLINVTRPTGVNTIGSSNKIANYDLRTAPPCPKMVVSPWMNSSVEQALDMKGLN